MEQQRTMPRPAPTTGGGSDPSAPGMATTDAQEILAVADRILDGIRPINAERYLQQNQQRGGQ
jgi:hypothetical protein